MNVTAGAADPRTTDLTSAPDAPAPGITRGLPRVADDRLAELRDRIATTRLPRTAPAAASAPGPGADLAERLLAHWHDEFDWRAIEERVEQLGHLTTTTADGRRLAAIHADAAADRTTGDSTADAGVPILLVHGWPDSPLRFLDLIPLLTAAGHEVVAPAIPGYWYSDEPEGEMSRELAAEDFHALMTALGHDRYAVHGGDWGAAVAQSIAQNHPESVVGLHLTDVPFDLAYTIDRDSAGPAEIAYLDAIEKFGAEALYLIGNTTAPNLVATALQDSPIGLASWIGALYDAWSDDRIDAEHVIANAAALLLTDTVRSSMRLYSEPAQAWDDSAWSGEADTAEWSGEADTAEWSGEADTAEWSGEADAGGWAPTPVTVPTAFALFPADLGVAPKELADRYFAVERFTVMPRGGHFAALEQPTAVATDLVEFLAGRS
ncbi:epoxide hydrolase family protein [Gordonia soli]|uniref:Putative epoxide hydrolase n=1 Tax=Gordonia soli NBRC 108243 TaxID=1223545 RepID=M0QMC0_9ACTN|nr:epoxide hydrolase family protein [Gordonia soli]GAC69805.1 putative epoxide hydrolase [Gordonia soli NBRC 108243]